MRFIVLVKADRESDANIVLDEKLLLEMGKFNEELIKAGVLLMAEGLHSSSKGVRVKFVGDERIVTNGPFPGTADLVAGFWLIQVKSKEEAVEWMKRAPNPMPGKESDVEIRQIFEAEDFGAEFTPELKEQEERLRAQVAEQR